jgi:uncharacterized protein YbjT (DUF2867 family)
MPHLVAITGATGNNGRAITERLLAGGVAVRAVARDAVKLAPLVSKGAEPWVGDIADTAFLGDAFRGAHAVFAMIPQDFRVPDYAADQRRMVGAVAEALRAAGVSRVVALSTPAARLGIGPPVALREFEERLGSNPRLSSVVLHPMYYMENFLASIPMVKTAGIMGGAIRGDVALPMVATRDVAALAAEFLLRPDFEGSLVKPLTGPRDYTFREAAATLGAAIGSATLPYVDLAYDDFRRGLLGAGFSETAADAFIELAQAYNDGLVQQEVTRTAENSTPTTLDQFAREIFAPAYAAA